MTLLDTRFGTRFVKRLRAGANVSLAETDENVVDVSAVVQEVSPGFGNRHLVHGSPLKSYPLVAGTTSRSRRAWTPRA